jgi:saccharopine dehydrogenase (NADP+, L-glutamate forming)
MKHILLLGAGRSSYSLIQYLLAHAPAADWHIRIGDQDPALAAEKIGTHARAQAFAFRAEDLAQCRAEVAWADLVVSLLPAALHLEVAKSCVALGKHLITASYVSEGMQALHQAAEQKNVLLLNEMGLDPGIDHLSAMAILDHLRQKGAEITAFRSSAGGLVAPQSDTNPWGYKFTWNPRNVVLAGQGTVKYIQNRQLKFTPYHRLFASAQPIEIQGVEGSFEVYPNRDSLSYRSVYQLENVPTMLRGTIRRSGYGKAWQALVTLGMTDDSYTLEVPPDFTYRDFTNSFLAYDTQKTLEEKVCDLLQITPQDVVFQKIKWLGLFENKPLLKPHSQGNQFSPAQILQALLETKWKLEADDKDMIVMQHQIKYLLEGKAYKLTSDLVVLGKNQQDTAMAQTVGLPLGIAAKLVLEGKIALRGVCVPVQKQIYEPTLAALADFGIAFSERTEEIATEELYT